jgi:SPP1 family predicted phage head-tail adaptor
MQAGQLRKRVVLEKRVPTSDAEGSPIENWVAVGTIWAQVTPAGGTEQLQAAQEEARITHQVTLRYRADLDPSVIGAAALHNLRLALGSRILDVKDGTSPDERHIELDLNCVERQR